MDIVGKIFQGQTPVTDISHVDFGGNEAEEIECLNYIEGLTPATDEAEGLKISRIRTHKNCPDITLARLAYRGWISIRGLYSVCAPRNQRILARVDADYPIIIENVISANHFFMWDFQQARTYAFAWYMGHLHVFEWFRMGNIWRPITDISTPENNHYKILNTFFLNHKVTLDFASRDRQGACSSEKKGSSGRWASYMRRKDIKNAIEAVRIYDLGFFSSPLPTGSRGLLG
ncbi:BgTH12-05382 [Blumeria graminis f. sp. triticale]|uniref:BgTH12-05382 n=1 Tax=Blumeria graminis f. sp. triticale TaxID=1689686 RepID=A0A9W4GEQ4_BLUGR|nr:BgTH12-05382 [Blumeria graminis f. sp. triticale]